MKNRLTTLLLCMAMTLILLPAMASAVSVSTQAELDVALANAAVGDTTTIELSAGTFTLPNGSLGDKSFIFTSAENAVLDLTGLHTEFYADELTFEGVTLKFSDTAGHVGLTHTSKVVCRNTTIKGKMFCFAPTVEFTNCTFENKKDYCVWTYGATDVTFSNCTFITGGKAILVYNESVNQNFETDIKLSGCTFNSDGSLGGGKAAVETGSDAAPGQEGANTYRITFEDCSATGFTANNSNSPLYGNKNNMSPEQAPVTIDDFDARDTLYPEKRAAADEIEAAVAAVTAEIEATPGLSNAEKARMIAEAEAEAAKAIENIKAATTANDVAKDQEEGSNAIKDVVPSAPSVPQTGDAAQVMLWAALLILSATVLVMFERKRKAQA